MWVAVAGGTDLGSQLPPDRAFALGGTTFPGYQLDELRMRRYWTASGSFLWRLVDEMPIQNKANPVPNGTLFGGSIYLGGQTPVGALTLGRPIGTGSILDKSPFR
jgi:hypothetical protein